ncbi:MAG: S9 family peptidase [Bacteroidota bacterium]
MFRLLLIVLIALPALAQEADTVATASDAPAAITTEGVGAVPAEVIACRAPYSRLRTARFAGWMPDGDGMLISTRFGDLSQVHHVASPGSARRQLTYFDEAASWMALRPGHPNEVLVAMAKGGDEKDQLYLLDTNTGVFQLLSDGVSNHGYPIWSTDGSRYVYGSTKRNGRDFDLYVATFGEPLDAHRRVLAEGGAWWAIEWSPTDEHLIVMQYVSGADLRAYELDVATGELQQIVDPSLEGAPAAYDLVLYAGETGDYLYATRQTETEAKRLYRIDRRTGEHTAIDTGTHEVESFSTSAHGGVAYALNVNGLSQLHVFDGTEHVDVPDLPAGLIYGVRFNDTSRKLAFTYSGPRSPGDVYVADLDAGSVERWTYSEVGGLDPERFVEPKLVRLNSFDGLEIQAWYYQPAGDGPFPVYVKFHGGPEAQTRPLFSSDTQFLVHTLGIAVVEPNVRGSTGYGPAFQAADNGFKRFDAVRDAGAVLDWIGQQPELDTERVAVAGASYGGYMALASMVEYSDRVRAGVDLVGITDFVTFLENTGAYRQDARRAEYGDERDPEMRAFLKSISPLTHADRITQPLLVGQGLNDPRVPASESRQIVDAVRAAGGDVWYVAADNEGHGFKRKENATYFAQVRAHFLIQHLLDGNGGVCSASLADAQPAPSDTGSAGNSTPAP